MSRKAGRRSATSDPPKHLRVLGDTVVEAERDAIERALRRKLGKFAGSITRVSVRLSDVNGPKGGVDRRCLIKVVLRGLPSVVVEERDSVRRRALNTATDAAVRAVRSAVQRRRTKPMRPRRPRPARQAS